MAKVSYADRALGQAVLVRLLDSAQGRPIQVWRFAEKSVISIGRADEADVTLADQQVSRAHAKLVFREGAWTLVSLGRNGTLVDDRLIGEAALTGPTVFRLGPGGPMLRFELEQDAGSASETISTIMPDMLAMLEVDDERKQQEADEISNNSLFKDLLDHTKQLKAQRDNSQQ